MTKPPSSPPLPDRGERSHTLRAKHAKHAVRGDDNAEPIQVLRFMAVVGRPRAAWRPSDWVAGVVKSLLARAAPCPTWPAT